MFSFLLEIIAGNAAMKSCSKGSVLKPVREENCFAKYLWSTRARSSFTMRNSNWTRSRINERGGFHVEAFSAPRCIVTL